MTNSRSIEDLHPTLQRGVNELIRRCRAINLPILITQTYRDKEYQDYLHSQGRTRPGSVVTNAKGGQSMHNFRLAFDFCKNVKGQEYSDNIFFQKVGAIWKEMGGEWGGDWKFVDKPHCQFTNGRPDREIFAGYKMPENTKMKWELEKPIIKKVEQEEKKYMIRDIKILNDGKEVEVTAILENNENYVKLKDLEKLGFEVSYDEAKKMPETRWKVRSEDGK